MRPDFRIGFDQMPVPLVLVRCRRCHRTAGVWCADSTGAGAWRSRHRRRCRCDPPVELPDGEELDELIGQARRSMRFDGRAALSVFR